MIEIDPEITIGRDKALDKTCAGNDYRRNGFAEKTLAEMMAEIEVGEVLTLSTPRGTRS